MHMPAAVLSALLFLGAPVQYSVPMSIAADSSPDISPRSTLPLPADAEVTNPRLISRTDPIYPDEAHAAELEASIILQFVVRKDGTVETDDKSCIRCVVNRKGKKPEAVLNGWCDDFCLSSREAVSQWKYEAGTRDGERVDVYFTVVLDYELE